MIRAVIFDCFGVLTTDGWLPFKKRHFGHDDQLVQEATDLNKQADTGLMSYDDFVDAVSKMAQIPAEQAYTEIEDNVANKPLFEFIATLKPTYKIGLLSNAPDDWIKELFSEQQQELFDAFALSYTSGFIKPDPRAYEAIAQQLGVQPEECVFVDDQERQCTGAREVGMQAIWFKDTDQAIADLRTLLQQSKA